ncbi:helix-turn-helix domain-containing protein [Actinomadura parmotrematis]|uniref:Helix-turn-helix transcriptional regulator n=1 Tax=Actinomadura parmotrematis TaxID=2864039 RepID=A0ABS7FMF4_9ACTN|nr:helix-turn-helix transcriptional regulator [Actinomadura parmotrematis]MBW8481562.1 helix-turn-helix transcriptional regulator [Actinomadura parmotrematis]
MGYYLRFLRESHGMTTTELARRLGCAQSSISRIEMGSQPMTDIRATAADELWRTGDLFGLLLYYARRATDPDWFRSFTAQERIALELRIFAALHVPGLAQTEAYASALLNVGSEPDIAGSLARRMQRKQVLERDRPPSAHIIMTENVIDWPVGGPKVMYEQLAYLLSLAGRPNVILRVVPRSTGAFEGLDGPFQILTLPDGPLAFVEAAVEGRLVADAGQVEGFSKRFERIGAQALPEGMSRDLIRRAMETLNV